MKASWCVLPQWYIPIMHTCDNWNAGFFALQVCRIVDGSPHHDNLFSCIQFSSYNWICRSITQLTLFIFVERASSVQSTMCNVMIHMKTYGGDNIWIFLIWFFNWDINPCTLHIATQHIFTMWKRTMYYGYSRIVDIAMSYDVWNICNTSHRLYNLECLLNRY